MAITFPIMAPLPSLWRVFLFTMIALVTLATMARISHKFSSESAEAPANSGVVGVFCPEAWQRHVEDKKRLLRPKMPANQRSQPRTREKSGLAQTQQRGVPMNTSVALEWVAFLPWSENDVREPLTTLPDLSGGPGVTVRIPPVVVVGAGTIWWLLKDGAMIRQTGGKTVVYTAHDVGLDSVVGLVPLPDGGAVICGGAGDNNRLVRIDHDGKTLWAHTGLARTPGEDPTELTGRAPRLVVDRVDADDTPQIVLLAESGMTGARLDITTGHRHPLPLVPELRGPTFVRDGALYRVMMLAGSRAWARTPLGGGDTQYTVPTDTTLDLLAIRQALPHGGALLGTDRGFVWLSANGDSASVPLVGLVRQHEQPVALVIKKTTGQQPAVIIVRPGIADVTLNTGTAEISGIKLVAANTTGFVVEQPQSGTTPVQWVTYAVDGTQVAATKPGDWLHKGGRIDWTRPIVEPTGDILVVGTDQGGAYLVRIKKPSSI